jgi:hypothetical protein
MITMSNYRITTEDLYRKETLVIELFTAFKKQPMTLKSFSGRRICC